MGASFTILQVVPALGAGGVERTAVDVAAAAVRAGGRALIATNGGHLAREAEEKGAELVRLPVHSKNPFVMRANAGLLAALIRKERVDIVHARSRACAWSAWLACRRTRTPLVTTYAGIYNEGLPFKRFYNSVMARGDIVIANSRFTAAHVVRTHGLDAARIAVIPRGIDLARFDEGAVAPGRVAALRRQWGVPQGARIALLPGRLTRWKGQLVFVQAMAKLGQSAIGVIAGDAQGRESYALEIVQAIADAGLGERMRVAPHCDDMPAAYLAADAVVSASTDPEAFGRVAVEAQAMGRIVVASNLGATRETIKDGETGFLVPSGDAEALARGIARALALSEERRFAMGALARAHARANFSREAMCEKTLDVYRQAIEARREKILVIKLSALGDFVQALGPMKAIREHHAGAEITLLTTPPYAGLAELSGWFDRIWDDGRPKGPLRALALLRRLRRARFDRVYDLQTSGRSSLYFQALRPNPPEWSGVAMGCSHPHANPKRAAMHTIERQKEQLAMAGIADVPPPDLSFVPDDEPRFGLPAAYALLVPGGAEHRPGKRWPAERYGALARHLAAKGIAPVIVGGENERALAEEIAAMAPGAVILAGETTLADLVRLARRAKLAIGNDTGPMHLIAAAGAPTLVLFSHESDPARCGQRGARVEILRVPELASLSVETVLARLP